MKKFRGLVSLLSCLHLLAVFAEPFRFFSQSNVKPTAEDAGFLRSNLAPYVEFMYLSHGYAFFAPNPGPSHLLQCDIKLDTQATSSPLVPLSAKAESDPSPLAPLSGRGAGGEGSNRKSLKDSTQRIFPDRRIDRPRLLYHRYFMLSEFYHTLFAPAKLSEADLQEPGLRERWEFDRRLYEQLQASIRRRLQAEYGAESIELHRVEHALPSRQQILGEDWKLTDPRLYLELPEGDSQP